MNKQTTDGDAIDKETVLLSAVFCIPTGLDIDLNWSVLLALGMSCFIVTPPTGFEIEGIGFKS